jgi:hypothetical protein
VDYILTNKPVLVGLHLGFAIVGIDLSLWLLGELIAKTTAAARKQFVSWGAFAAFMLSWVIGGYYYVKYYGPIVKPIIIKSAAPWAHAIIMESKEHVFLFLIPMGLTVALISHLNSTEALKNTAATEYKILVGLVAGLGLLVGLMGFIISAAARWA